MSWIQQCDFNCWKISSSNISWWVTFSRIRLSQLKSIYRKTIFWFSWHSECHSTCLVSVLFDGELCLRRTVSEIDVIIEESKLLKPLKRTHTEEAINVNLTVSAVKTFAIVSNEASSEHEISTCYGNLLRD